MYSNGVPYTFQNGMAVFHPPEGYSVPTQPQPAYPMVMAPYMTQPGSSYYQQSPSPMVAMSAATMGQYVYAAPMMHAQEMIFQHQYQPADLADASMIEASSPPEYYTGPQYTGTTSLC